MIASNSLSPNSPMTPQRTIWNAHQWLVKAFWPLALAVPLVPDFPFLFLLCINVDQRLNANVLQVLALESLFFSFYMFSLCNSSTPKVSIMGYDQVISKQSPEWNSSRWQNLNSLTWSCMPASACVSYLILWHFPSLASRCTDFLSDHQISILSLVSHALNMFPPLETPSPKNSHLTLRLHLIRTSWFKGPKHICICPSPFHFWFTFRS